jgi:hypothetical protein
MAAKFHGNKVDSKTFKAELKPGKNKILFDQNNAAFVR